MELLAIISLYILTLAYLTYRDYLISKQLRDIINGMNNVELTDSISEETSENIIGDEIVNLEDVSPEDLLKIRQ